MIHSCLRGLLREWIGDVTEGTGGDGTTGSVQGAAGSDPEYVPPELRSCEGCRLGSSGGKCGEAYSDKPGHPSLATRLMAGLMVLKYTDNLSDEELCARWLENPYYQ